MRVSRITLAGLVALLAAGVGGAPMTGDAAPVRSEAPCTPGGDIVTQAQNGRIDTCLRLGNLDAGPHTISFQDLQAYGPTPPKLLPPPSKRRPLPTPPPSEPAVALSLSPASGGPGTVVTVTGRLRRPLVAGAGHPNLCWDGCGNGLGYGDVEMTWTSRRSFRTRMIVPAAPWIEGGPPHVVPLVSGDYQVAIDCLREARACSSITEGAATFHLRVTRPVNWCRTQARCGRLRVTPAQALPGQVVRVTGFVPLASGNTPDAGSPYETVVLHQVRRQRAFRFTGAARLVTVGLGAIVVKAPPTYAGQGRTAPVAELSDGVPRIAANPADPTEVAWCAGQTIAVAGPSGTTTISTATVNATLQAMGFSLRYEPQPSCAAVAPLATSTGAPAGLAAAFYVTTKVGPPPEFLAALVTHDNGQTWAPIPVPSTSAPYGLAGFRYSGTALHAIFALSINKAPNAYPELDPVRTVTEASSPDGQSWREAPLGCPSAGPCVTFGPYQPGNCAMNGTTQALLRSTDGGARWSALDFPYAVQACWQAQLIATSPASELLVDATSDYPVLRTIDGGATWHDIAIPKPPVGSNITALPGGALLVTPGLDYRGHWKLLRRGAHRWCPVQTPSSAAQRRFQLAGPTVIAQTLWWLTGPVDNPDAAPAINQLPLSALSC